MATLAERSATGALGDERFFLRGAIAIAATIVAGFSFQLAMGRSTFASPPLVHAHAIVFMGWVAIYLAQNVLVASDRILFHRRLGWMAVGWLGPMLLLGFLVTVAMVRRGHVPFFFQPLQFLVFDPLSLVAFTGLTLAAVRLRNRTEWHRRLHFCGMTMLTAPAFGRLLPLPLLQPWAWEATFAATMVFPIAGVLADRRRRGRAHPAWAWGIGTMIATFLLIEAISYSPVGTALYRAATAGSPGAEVPALEFPPPPEGPLRTGRD